MSLKKLDLIKYLSSYLGYSILFLTFILIIFFPKSYNLDYGPYLKLYDKAELFAEIRFNSINFFCFILSVLNNLISYENFRLLLALTQISIFGIILKRINYIFKNLGFFSSLPIFAFLVLKVHIQIRESISILLWMLSLFDCVKGKTFSKRNSLLFIFSFLIHSSSLIWWLPTLIIQIRKFSLKTKKILIILFFALIGCFFNPFIFKTFIQKIIWSSATEWFFSPVVVDYKKIIYWLAIALIIFINIIQERQNKSFLLKNGYERNTEIVNIFGFIGIYGSIGFLPIIFLNTLTDTYTSHGYSQIYRIVFNLIIFICLYKNIISPKNIYSITLSFFIGAEIFRMFFYRDFINLLITF